MKRNLKYSVIIPVYNAEYTIKRCLDSLLYQIPEMAELLVINDGSNDQSGEICRCYAEKYSAVRYFEKENGGVSTARNIGLDYAEGEYILFGDSDDYVDPSYWSVIDSLIEKHHPDMLQWGFRECGETVKERHTGDYAVSGEFAVAGKIDVALRRYMFSALWARSYKKSIIQKYGLRFKPELVIGEDQVFIFAYAMHVNTLVSTSTILYHSVLDNKESLSRKRRDYLTEQLLLVNNAMRQMLASAKLSTGAIKIYRSALAWVYYRSVYSACKELLKYDMSKQKRRKKIKIICNQYVDKKVRAMDAKCKIIAFPVVHKMSLVIDMLICRS